MAVTEARGRDTKVRAALTAAKLYYLQDMTMEAIARELGTSRSSVSRLLGYARDTGLVDIRVNSPFERAGMLEQRIRDRFRVAAHVVPMPGVINEVERMERVALTAGRLLSQFIDSNMVVGIAWGSTISMVSRSLVQKDTHNTTFVQLNGAGNTQTSGLEYSSDILQRFGRAFGAQVEQFPVPAFFDDPATREAMWRERSTRRVLAYQAKMDVAVFSLGSPAAEVPSRVYVGGYLSEEDYRNLREDGAIGDVATVFFRADGSWRDIRLNARATGPGLDRLRRVPRRVCIVSGVAKLDSLRAAIAAGVVTDVVLDETLARGLAEQGER
ncbi:MULTISPECIES: sugar-binding transcriptional regulator [Microbacterium]|uniref:sugar-binding transcriptional regulator n=1 Tax=Microbacterium TaxID=33882 RepID=UPI00217DD7D7|nr:MULTISPECIES: sugar-binding domain-containing protein [Microbacterium]UWF78463.1 sugar-binding transcriptional regulator [Microbacterium neungamense]WCM56640.1 sugar-binding transcriptional regulator [Microbacterium sp. EF45047]